MPFFTFLVFRIMFGYLLSFIILSVFLIGIIWLQIFTSDQTYGLVLLLTAVLSFGATGLTEFLLIIAVTTVIIQIFGSYSIVLAFRLPFEVKQFCLCHRVKTDNMVNQTHYFIGGDKWYHFCFVSIKNVTMFVLTNHSSNF